MTLVRTNASLMYTSGYTRRVAERKIPCATFCDHPAAFGTTDLPPDFNAPPPLTRTEMACCFPGVTNFVTSNTDGVNDVVLVATILPSTDSVAW